MTETELTTQGLIEEATTQFRKTREVHGRLIEKKIAQRKLQQIVDGDTKLSNDNDKGADNLDIWVTGLLDDYAPVEVQTPGISEAVNMVAEKTKKSVRDDLNRTVEQYESLTFSEEKDPTLVAVDNNERAAIITAAELMGYRVNYGENNSVTVTASKPHEVGGDLERIIRARINVGVLNLLDDYDDFSSDRALRRPVRRQIVAMADHMAKTLRGETD